MAPPSTNSLKSPASSSNCAHVAPPPMDVAVILTHLQGASPLEMIELERQGIDPQLLHVLSVTLGVSLARLCEILGVPRGTVKRLCSTGKSLRGASGLAAINLLRLLGLAQDVVQDCAPEDAEPFDVGMWLGRWIQTPQPSLGGRKPAEILDTPTGFALSTKLLGALRSNSYQ